MNATPLNAKEMAVELKRQEALADKVRESYEQKQREDKDRQASASLAMIRRHLKCFSPDFVMKEDDSHVDQPINLCRPTGEILLSCCLKYVTGTWDPSDDCRNVPFAEWQIFLCPGPWRYDSNGDCVTKEEWFIDAVARIMKRYV